MSEINKDLLSEYNHLYHTYRSIEPFLLSHENMSYVEFDYYSVHDFSLFSLEVDFDFNLLTKTIKRITSTLSSIKRIFAKPIIHLKDGTSVLPVESVRTVNQNTLQYAATHSETISTIDRQGVKPIKLLTKVYEDNYGIYENVAFCNIIDEIMSYTRKNWRILKSIIYNNRVLELNLLERLNHLNYFLALGKLHTGYIRDFGKYYAVAKNDLSKLNFIYDAIQPRLKAPVYSKNKNRNKSLAIRKTNIFKMQKDYHQVYNLYLYLQKNVGSQVIEEDVPIHQIQANYFHYCEMLALFAVGNFNFEMDRDDIIDIKKLYVNFSYKNWHICIKTINSTAILFIIEKGDKSYRLLMIPTIEPKKRDELMKLGYKHVVDECFIVTPFEEDYLNGNLLCLSKEDVESFRRIQQYVLKGMIYTDDEKAECPFCSSKLTYDAELDRYECESCRLIIERVTCPVTEKSYYQTKISNLEIKPIVQEEFKSKNNWLLSLEVEALMHYRNITKINDKGEIICPYCGKVHPRS